MSCKLFRLFFSTSIETKYPHNLVWLITLCILSVQFLHKVTILDAMFNIKSRIVLERIFPVKVIRLVFEECFHNYKKEHC